jgi:hypothetical protein
MDFQYVCKIMNDAIHQPILHSTGTWAEDIGIEVISRFPSSSLTNPRIFVPSNSNPTVESDAGGSCPSTWCR